MVEEGKSWLIYNFSGGLNHQPPKHKEESLAWSYLSKTIWGWHKYQGSHRSKQGSQGWAMAMSLLGFWSQLKPLWESQAQMLCSGCQQHQGFQNSPVRKGESGNANWCKAGDRAAFAVLCLEGLMPRSHLFIFPWLRFLPCCHPREGAQGSWCHRQQCGFNLPVLHIPDWKVSLPSSPWENGAFSGSGRKASHPTLQSSQGIQYRERRIEPHSLISPLKSPYLLSL